MNENNKNQELSFFDLCKALFKKGKIIIAITLALLLVCGAGGAVLAFLANSSYGTRAEFYIYSDKANNYILSLIQSDSFAEALLLDENGLPAEDKNTDAYKKALAAKQAIEAKELEIEELEEELEAFPLELTRKQKKLSEAQSKYDDIYKLLNMYKQTDIEFMEPEAKEAHIKQIATFEVALAEARTNKEAAQEAYNLVYDSSKDLEKNIADAKKDVLKLEKEADEASADLLEAFRKRGDNEYKIRQIKESVTYEYAEGENNASQALLYVNIAVKNDEEFAKFLLDQISMRLVDFVEEETPTTHAASCEYISTFSAVDKIEEKNVIVETIKLGIVGAAVGFIGTSCVVLVVFAFTDSKKKSEER